LPGWPAAPPAPASRRRRGPPSHDFAGPARYN